MSQTNPEWWGHTGAHPGTPQPTGGYPVVPSPPPAAPRGPAGAPPHLMASPAGRTPLVVTGFCGLAALLSYFALPAVSTPFASVSMSTLLSLASGFSGRGSGLTGLIVVPMLVIAGCGLLGALGSLRGRSVAAGIAQLPAIILLLCYLLPLIGLIGESNSSSSSFGRIGSSIALSMLGAGYYVTLLGLIGAIVASAIAHRDVRAARRAGW